MATYKVIQDIEAEDKLVGPFSLRQFIYAGAAAFLCYLSVLCVMKGAAFMLAVFVPVILFCMFFAWPWSPDQPTEVWALARIRFHLKPRRRIWDQTGMKHLVTVTAPKRVEKIYTNGLSQTEVRSRLTALANTIDSRGWVIKNATMNLSTAFGQQTASDRLIDFSSMPQEVSSLDIQAADDIMDAANNPIAQQFDQMINASSKAHRQQIVDRLKQDAAATASQQQPPADYWFMNQTPPSVGSSGDVMFANPAVVQPGLPAAQAATPDDEAAYAAALQQNAAPRTDNMTHLKNIQPIIPGQHVQQNQTTPLPANPVTPPAQPDPAIINLASNNDLDIATLARQAHKAQEDKDGGEVVISLH
jgi:hypothetical protein